MNWFAQIVTNENFWWGVFFFFLFFGGAVLTFVNGIFKRWTQHRQKMKELDIQKLDKQLELAKLNQQPKQEYNNYVYEDGYPAQTMQQEQ